MQVIKTTDTSQLAELKKLYIETFSTGISEQYIDDKELDNYLLTLFSSGYALVMIENEKIIGALLACPLSYDKLLPEEIRRNYHIESGIYIAEMMVAAQFRGLGIGKKLMNQFIKTIDYNLFSDAFIRVWDKNIPALTLYQSFGFKQIATIDQVKICADGKGKYKMKKIYLHKKIDLKNE